MSEALKICIFSRHYPPAIAGGSRRPFFLARALAEAGVDVCVVAPDADPDLPSIVVPHPNRDPAVHGPNSKPESLQAQARNVARDWLLWPDPDIRWTHRAAARAIDELPFRPDWILTTSPPESIHRAGGHLKRHLGCRWVADFRDQWFLRSFRKIRHNPVRRLLERQVGRAMLAPLDTMTAVNESIAQEVGRMAPPQARHNALILPHFTPPLPSAIPFEGQGPHLVHAGSFSLSDPACLITPVLSAFEAAQAASPGLRLHLVGRLTLQEQTEIRQCRARDAITCHGVVPLDRSLGMQQGADALIVAAAPGAPVPPGKLAECLGMLKPIIAFGNREWRMAYGLGDSDPTELMKSAERLTPPTAPPAQKNWRQTGDDLAQHLRGIASH